MNRSGNRASKRCVDVFVIVAFSLTATSLYGQTSTAPKTPPALGTLKSVSQNQVVLTADGGSEITVQLPADVKVLRVPPGSKDLKEATMISLSDLQTGDRVLLRMRSSDSGSSAVATTIIVMKKSDIADRQAKEREDWQKHGIGGLIKTVDAPNGTITVGVLSASGPKDIVVHVGKDTVLRRYVLGSVKFDEAKTAPVTEIHAGDQLRARGSRSADGNEFAADEIVSGSFRNIAGPVTALDASAGTVTVNDIATKKPVELRITSDSQMRKLPQPMAQRIAVRLKGDNGPTVGQQATAAAPAAGAAGGTGGGGGAAGGPPRSGGAGDMQQMLSRLPASPLSDFQKGDVVMVVATSDPSNGQIAVITLLGGVEPILQATNQGQAASILSTWTLSQGGAGDAGTP
jgi:hypothetical protein